ncbi:MAG: hypothetical protein JWL88_261 [Parcubacteria group bacterium]|nr:hypothetical protein [Parcubacteria group bacterium]
MRKAWNKGLTKETDFSVAKTSETMKSRGLDNFKIWRDEAKRTGQIKSTYPELEKNGNLAELIGVILGDGHIGTHPRCESLRIVGSGNNSGFRDRYASIVETVFGKIPHVALRSKNNAYNITLYEKHIAERLGILAGNRSAYEFVLPAWIEENQKYRIRFLRGLYEAEGSLSFHPGTYTHKFIFTNMNPYLLDIVFGLVSDLGFHPHRTSRDIQVSRKAEVQKLADLLQFRHYGL